MEAPSGCLWVDPCPPKDIGGGPKSWELRIFGGGVITGDQHKIRSQECLLTHMAGVSIERGHGHTRQGIT